MRRSPRPTTPTFSHDDPRVVLRALLRRARRQLFDDVRQGRLTPEQAQQLFDATTRSYAKRLGLSGEMLDLSDRSNTQQSDEVSDSSTLVLTRQGDG